MEMRDVSIGFDRRKQNLFLGEGLEMGFMTGTAVASRSLHATPKNSCVHSNHHRGVRA